MPLQTENAKAFYDIQYQGGRYASHISPEAHPFHHELNGLVARYGRKSGKWLEVGCGRGLLQDVVADYTGVDITEAVAPFLKKSFQCASAEELPFIDSLFDGVWSYAVLEHVVAPERALAEMRRVMKPGGILFLSPAWQCRSWAGRDFAWKPFCELSLLDRLRKASIPLRNGVVFRAMTLMPCRILRLLGYFLRQTPTRFRSRRLKPNYNEYRVADADALHYMDPFEAILWFRSRGDHVRSHPGWLRALCVRTGTLVVEVCKS